MFICQAENDKTLKTTNIEKELLALYAKLWQYAYSITRDHDRADDLVQETALKILINRDKFKYGTNFWGWAQKIMLNSYINSMNREKRVLAVGELNNLSGYNTAFARNSQTNEYNDIYNAVNSLPEERRETMNMLIHGHKYNEIAFVLKVPLGTVKSRISNSRIILKEILKDYVN